MNFNLSNIEKHKLGQIIKLLETLKPDNFCNQDIQIDMELKQTIKSEVLESKLNGFHNKYRQIDSELEQTIKLLKALKTQGLPDGFYDKEDIQINSERYYCYMFLSNSEEQLARLDSDGILKMYYITPSGMEGFAEELKADYTKNAGKFYSIEDVEFLIDNHILI